MSENICSLKDAKRKCIIDDELVFKIRTLAAGGPKYDEKGNLLAVCVAVLAGPIVITAPLFSWEGTVFGTVAWLLLTTVGLILMHRAYRHYKMAAPRLIFEAANSLKEYVLSHNWQAVTYFRRHNTQPELERIFAAHVESCLEIFNYLYKHRHYKIDAAPGNVSLKIQQLEKRITVMKENLAQKLKYYESKFAR